MSARPLRERDDDVGLPPLSPAEERSLVERVRAGDAAAFEALVRRHLRRAYAVAYRVLLHREDAEDLVQEAFMAALEHIETFDVGRPFAPWLCRIVLNRALNARRSRALRRTEPVSEVVGDTRPAPDVDVERAEVRERFAAALDRLPERQRLVVRLIDGDGLDAAAVAAMLDVAPGTIRWYLHQARTALRAALAPLHGDDP
ncbi:MAG TPA: sigma-70 family RNA polymerase sigma factor [Gemmatimonadaceae bacterium]|nr:sigma-70 family RNA polymerase sigma factor [Gemmatimonadaceae bacterium]